MAKRTTTKQYLLDLLNDLSNHNIHTSDEQDWPGELRDRVHNLIDCLEKSSDGIPADLENANCAIFDVMRSKNFDIEKCKVVGNRLLMYEQDLPNMTDDEYNIWFESSEIVDGVRMGKIFIAS